MSSERLRWYIRWWRSSIMFVLTYITSRRARNIRWHTYKYSRNNTADSREGQLFIFSGPRTEQSIYLCWGASLDELFATKLHRAVIFWQKSASESTSGASKALAGRTFGLSPRLDSTSQTSESSLPTSEEEVLEQVRTSPDYYYFSSSSSSWSSSSAAAAAAEATNSSIVPMYF